MRSIEWQSSVAGFRFRMVGTPEPLPQPVQDPLHKAHFSYRVQGGLAETPFAPLFEVYAQRQPLYPYAERACRLLLHCYELARTRLRLEHPLRYERRLRIFLMTEGKAGAEQQRDLLYLYDLSERIPSQEWLRELTHEYGHWVIPPINSFTEPEAWANGDLGERWFTYWLTDALRQGKLQPQEVMETPLSALETYLQRAVHPLVERMWREGLHPQRWRSRKREGYEEYLALALYADRIYGSERFGRAMLIAGGVEPDDFLNGLRESLSEQTLLTANLPGRAGWLFLPNGLKAWRIQNPGKTKLVADPKRPEWVYVESANATLQFKPV